MDFAKRLTQSLFGRERHPMDVEAQPDNRTLYEVYGDSWLTVATAKHLELKSSDPLAARRWAHARPSTRLRDIERVADAG